MVGAGGPVVRLQANGEGAGADLVLDAGVGLVRDAGPDGDTETVSQWVLLAVRGICDADPVLQQRLENKVLEIGERLVAVARQRQHRHDDVAEPLAQLGAGSGEGAGRAGIQPHRLGIVTRADGCACLCSAVHPFPSAITHHPPHQIRCVAQPKRKSSAANLDRLTPSSVMVP